MKHPIPKHPPTPPDKPAKPEADPPVVAQQIPEPDKPVPPPEPPVVAPIDPDKPPDTKGWTWDASSGQLKKNPVI